MKRFLWIITVPLTLAAVIFAIANRAPVTLDLWPLVLQLEVPLFLVLLLSLLVGFLVGGLVVWFASARHRARARRAERRLAQMEEENRRLRAVVSAPRRDPLPPAKSVLPAA